MPDPKGQIQEAEEKQPEAVSTSNETEQTLPEDAKERTRQEFEKLTKHNQELAQRVKELEAQKTQQNSVFDSLRPQEPVIPVTPTPTFTPAVTQMFPSLTPTQVNQISQDLIDKDGYLNEQALKNALSDAQKKAEDANSRIQQLENKLVSVEENAQVRSAHEKFPSLNPRSPQFDSKFYDAVKNEVVGQMIRGEGKDLLAAAEQVSGWYSTTQPANPKTQEEVKKKEQQVAQINATSKSVQSTNRYTTADQDTLVKATMKGSHEALMERLRRAGL